MEMNKLLIQYGIYTFNDEIELPTPTKDDFVFAGWYTDETLSGNSITNIVQGTTGDIILFAKWNSLTDPYGKGYNKYKFNFKERSNKS